MTDTYTVPYQVNGNSRPHVFKTEDETEAIRFSAQHPGSMIKRESDGKYLDRVTGTWIKIAQSPST